MSSHARVGLIEERVHRRARPAGIEQRADSHDSRNDSILHSQQTVGNQSVQRMLANTIQRDFWDDAQRWGSSAAGAVGGAVGGAVDRAASMIPQVSGDVHIGSGGLDVSGSASMGGTSIGGELHSHGGTTTGAASGQLGRTSFSAAGSNDGLSGSVTGPMGSLSGTASGRGVEAQGETTVGGTRLSGSGAVDPGLHAVGSLAGSSSSGSNWGVSGSGILGDPNSVSASGEYHGRQGNVAGTYGSGGYGVSGDYTTAGGSSVSGHAGRSGGGPLDWDIDGHT